MSTKIMSSSVAPHRMTSPAPSSTAPVRNITPEAEPAIMTMSMNPVRTSSLHGQVQGPHQHQHDFSHTAQYPPENEDNKTDTDPHETNETNEATDNDESLPTFFVQAEYPFESIDSSALSFKEGDVIEVLTRLESGWWDGLAGDRRGWFPSNYVRLISDEEAEEWFLQREVMLAGGIQEGAGREEGEEEEEYGGVAMGSLDREEDEDAVNQYGPATWIAKRLAETAKEDQDEHDDHLDLDLDLNLDLDLGELGLDSLAKQLMASNDDTDHNRETEDDRHQDLFYKPKQSYSSRPHRDEIDEGHQDVFYKSQPSYSFHRNDLDTLIPTISPAQHSVVSSSAEDHLKSSSSPAPTQTPETGVIVGDPSDFWIPSLNDDGQIYYHNTQTGEDAWELPNMEGPEIPITPLTDAASLTSSGRLRKRSLQRKSIDPLYPLPRRTSSISSVERLQGFGSYTQARLMPNQSRLKDDGSGYILSDIQSGGHREALEAFSFERKPIKGGETNIPRSSSARRISQTIFGSLGHRASISQNTKSMRTTLSNAISVEKATLARINAELIPPPVDDATRLKLMLDSIDDQVTIVITSAENYIAACASTSASGAIDPHYTDLPEAQKLNEAVGQLIPEIRVLITTSRHAVIGLCSLLGESNAVGPYATNERIHPAQRRVLAALSKVVFFCHSAVGMSWPLPGTVERLASDTLDLLGAIKVFVRELYRFGALSEGGLGLKPVQPAFGLQFRYTSGTLTPNETRKEWTRINEETIKEVKIRCETIMASRDLPPIDTESLNDHFGNLLKYISDIDAPATLDIDGVLRSDGAEIYDKSGKYNQLASQARDYYRQYDDITQRLFDNVAMLLLKNPEEGDTAASEYSALAFAGMEEIQNILATLFAIGSEQNNALVELSWRGRIGKRSIRIAERERNYRHIRSGSHSSSLTSTRVSRTPSRSASISENAQESLGDVRGARPSKRPSLTRSMTSFDQLNPLSGRRRSTATNVSRVSASSSMTSLSAALEQEGTTANSFRNSTSNLIRGLSFMRNRSGSDVDDKRLPKSGSKKKLVQMLGEADVNRLLTSPPIVSTPLSSPMSPPEKPFYLGFDYPESDLVINQKDGTIRAGTLPALIERLTLHESMDPAFNSTFMMTYRSFATAEQFVDLLKKRYTMTPPPGLTPEQLQDWQEHKQTPVKLRVFNTFKTWVDQHLRDDQDSEALDAIETFVTTVMANDPQLQMPIKHLIKAIERRRTTRGVLARRLTSSMTMPPAPIIPKVSAVKSLRVTDINPLELARQLTLMEAKLYNMISPTECMHKAWSQTDKPESGANIKAMILTSNRIAGWVAESILSYKDVKKRSALFKHFVLTAEHCRTLNNYSSMAAIMAGLNSTPIIRLKRTKDSLNHKVVTLTDDLDRTLDSGRNFASYRERLKQINPPCIPFLGVYLTYLTVLEENSDWLPHPTEPDRKLINFFKRQRSAEIIREIQQYQATPYNLSIIAPVQKFIESRLEAVDQAPDLYEVSLQIEPREREDEKLARVLRESGMI